MIYYAIILIFCLCGYEVNSAESTKGPLKLEPLEKIPSFKPLKVTDSFPEPKKSAQLEPLKEVPSFKPLKVTNTKKPVQLDPIPSKAESTVSTGSINSFTSVESYQSAAESMTSEGSSENTFLSGTDASTSEKTDDGLMPPQFHLTESVQRLMREGAFTPESVLEMLRPRPEVPDAFAISSKFYSPDGMPISGAIRVIEADSDFKGGFTDSLFLVQINTDFLQESAGGSEIAATKGIGIKHLKDLRRANWQTKLVIKVLKSENIAKRDGIRKITFEEIAKKQLRNLEKLKTSKLAYLDYFKNPALPRMTFDEASYYYVDSSGSKHYFSILHGAKGTSFSEVWRDYEDKKTGIDQVQESVYAIGQALGTFHVYTKKPRNIRSPDDFKHYTPIAHGDFYWQNVFYDFKTKRVYFIDNESMANSLEVAPPVETDFLSFYQHHLFGAYPNSKKCNINICSQEDMKLVYRTFFQGYIQAYPAALQPMLTDYIKKVVHDYNETVKKAVLPREVSNIALGEGSRLVEGERRLQLLFDGIFS